MVLAFAAIDSEVRTSMVCFALRDRESDSLRRDLDILKTINLDSLLGSYSKYQGHRMFVDRDAIFQHPIVPMIE